MKCVTACPASPAPMMQPRSGPNNVFSLVRSGMRVGTTDDDMATVLTEILDQAADSLTPGAERHR